ncbi:MULTISPECIES: glycosyltransferase [unclassified Lactobacillus]|uniref:glycosyltransferase n=1 Tax=unclassified Lactobacillus TaxID=2620435 RepID=UPI000BEEEDD8|nr:MULTISPECIES: glycosyltransferase [unclassified Lactobacillus]PEG86526.1 hypothetical protein CP365_07435 [Lactobacillus sp. UMNPBX14]PEH02074.1 hypothetical protein CP357_07445 [Lactobacillus sp. UMNPBX6]
MIGNDIISCEILNYNDWKTTQSLVDKIKKYKVLDYIVVVDNASPDNSFNHLNQLYDNDSKVKVISTTKNGGYGYGNNFGIKYAHDKLKSKYVLLSNPDVFFTQKMLLSLVKVMKEKDAGIVSSVQTVHGKPVKIPAWKIPTAFEYTFSLTPLSKMLNIDYSYPSHYFSDPICAVDCVPGAMLLVDSSKFIEVGGFDEDMFLFCEETTIGFKMKKAGYKTYLANNETYDHQVSLSINKSIPQKNKQIVLILRNRLLFMERYLHEKGIMLFLSRVIFKMKIKHLEKESE